MQTRIVVSFIHGPEAKAHYLGPRDARQHPLLVVDDGQGLGQRVFIDPLVEYPSEIVTEDHVRFARELVEATQQYLAEMERACEHDFLKAFDDEPGEWAPVSSEGGEQTTGTAA